MIGLLFVLFFSLCNGYNVTLKTYEKCDKFTHNFCESRLQNNNSPELYNSYTSLFISTVPLIFGFPENEPFLYVSYSLLINGFASFYYHYYLNWIGKQADEISMIFANFFGLFGLFNIQFKKNKILNSLHFFNFLYMNLFLIINSNIKFDSMFPYFFSIYLIPTLYLIHIIGNNHKKKYIKYIFISSVGAISLIISEIFCNNFTFLVI